MGMQRMCGVGAGLEKIHDQKTDLFCKTSPYQRHGLPEVISGFKTFSARRINQIRCLAGVPVWQRNYYECIIRSEESLQKIRKYIIKNPLFWQQDK